ncbi:MAG: hypothetical protein DCC75_01070 [Proteobacteria bacterium]|nr:MAG: hypothetical protein DCC75_01070 [Pseudomonadota bacterium]
MFYQSNLDQLRPYDITPIPRFAFTPGLTFWLIFITFWAVLLLALWLRRCLENKKPPALDPLSAALIEITAISQRLNGGPLRRLDAEQISSALKRALASQGLIDLSALGIKEIETTRGDLHGMREIVQTLVKLEKVKYGKEAGSEISAAQLRALIDALQDLQIAAQRG